MYINDLISKIILWLSDIAILTIEPQRRIVEQTLIRYLINERKVKFSYLYLLAMVEIRLSAFSSNPFVLGKSVMKMVASTAANSLPFLGTHRHSKAVQDRFRGERVQLLVESLALDSHEQKDLTEKLLASRNEMDLTRRLAELQKAKIKNTLDPNKKTIATYSTSGAYREQFGNIIERLREKGYNAITLLGKPRSPEFGTKQGVFYAGLDIVSFMDFVDVFLTAGDAYPFLPTGAKVGLFLHDIHDSPLGNLDDILAGILFYDFQFIPSACVLERNKNLVGSAQKKLSGKIGNTAQTCLIPGGYIKLDSNIQYFEKNKRDSRTIIYAPTVFGPGFENMVSLDTYGDRIIGAVLENFPDYDLIFRPHPRTSDSQYVKAILAKYGENPRFAFDDNATFYMDNYSKATLMISDMSGTAFTYAFSTLRPVIFFSHNETKVISKIGEYSYFKDRGKIGYVVFNIDEMVEKIKLTLAHKEKLSAKVKQYRDSTIYNVGTAEDYFVNNFEYIIENKKHRDWVYL